MSRKRAYRSDGIPPISAVAPRSNPDLAAYRFRGLDGFVLFELAMRDDPPREVLTRLSAAERQVLRLVLEGRSNAEIGSARATSQRTVANQVASIFRKLGVASRRELCVRIERLRQAAMEADEAEPQ